MVRPRRSRPRRRVRRLLLLGGTVGGISALRNLMLARNEKRYASVIAEPPTDRSG